MLLPMGETTREGGLLAWQWRDYPRAHQNWGNLALHLIGGPLFVAGCVAALLGVATGRALVIGLGLLALAVGFALEGAGHRLEKERPAPFRGPGDLAARFLVEQWVTFPRYVLSGGWVRAWRGRGG